MLAAAIIVTAAAACGLLGWAAYWGVIDARERKREADRADAWVAEHRAQISRDRWLDDERGRP